MMVPLADSSTDRLLDRAAAGDRTAVNDLLARHRHRLRKMVSVRMDHRIAARVDPSDVVQEAMAEAAKRLPEYLKRRPIPFYAWLRQLAWNRLVDLYRFHVQGARRAVGREADFAAGLSDESVMALAQGLVASGTTPSRNDEAIERLTELDRRREAADGAGELALAYTCYFLAMAHQKAGNAEQAREYLNKANQPTDEALADKENPPPWNRRATLQLLRKEAEAIVKTGASAAADSKQPK